MEVNEDSIKMLELRMRQQLNSSSGKNIKPENIQYYVSSAMLQKEGVPQNIQVDGEKAIYQTVYEKLQDGQMLTVEEKGALQQKDPESYGKARSIEKENEDYWQELRKCRTKEAVQRVEEEHRRLARLGLSLTENNAVLSVERKVEYTLFKDAKISAIQNITRQFMESEEYEKLPTDAEYIEKSGGMPPRMEYMKIPKSVEIPESKESQIARAKSGYEKVRQSMDGGESSGRIRLYSLNVKG